MSSDPILIKATTRLEAARAEVARLEDFVRLYESFAGTSAATTVDEVAGIPRRPIPVMHKRKPPPNTKRADTVQTVSVARAFILAANRPVPLAELLEEVVRHRIELKGKKSSAVLDGRLRYSKQFVSVPGRGWWIKDRPVPQANGSTADAHQEQPAA